MFCEKCGAPVSDHAKLCSHCGAPVTPAGAASSEAGGAPAGSTDENKIFSVFAYIGALVVVPIVMMKQSGFIKYHANQGLVLFIFEIAYGITAGIISSVLGAIWSVLGSIVSAVLGVGWLAFIGLSVYGIVNAVNELEKPLPVIGHISILK